MNVITGRLKTGRLIQKMERNPEHAKRLGLKNMSCFVQQKPKEVREQMNLEVKQ